MKKRTIVFLVSLLVTVIGLTLLGVEIYDNMDPDRIRIYAYMTGLGLAGMFIALLLKLREREERIKAMLEDDEQQKKKGK